MIDRFKQLLLLSLLTLLASCKDDPSSKFAGPIVEAGIYAGAGAFGESVKACFAVVNAAGFTSDTLREADLTETGLDRFGLIIFPGGDAHRYSDELGPVGRGYIRSYVSNGGGYIGLGAGGAFAVSDSGLWPGIGLIPATTRYPSDRIAPNPYYALVEIEAGPNPGPVARKERYKVLYNGGPEFFPENAIGVTVDYLYNRTGSAAVVGGEYGYGRIWVTGVQPEFEEGLLRDGTNYGDDLPDDDSEWELIEAAFDHCLSIQSNR